MTLLGAWQNSLSDGTDAIGTEIIENLNQIGAILGYSGGAGTLDDDNFNPAGGKELGTAKIATYFGGGNTSLQDDLDDLAKSDAPTLTGTVTMSGSLKVGTLIEYGSGLGVTIDTLNIKDGKLNTNNSVVTANITNSAVSLSKIQSISTDRLLGRDTTGTGTVEELTVGDGLQFTGTGGIGIADDGVTYLKMQNIVNNNRIMGRISGAGGNMEELTGAQVVSILGNLAGDVTGPYSATVVGNDSHTHGFSTGLSDQIAIQVRKNTGAAQYANLTPVKVNWSTEVFDTGADFDYTTNDRFTAPATGYYLITGVLDCTMGTAGYDGEIYIYVNGVARETWRLENFDHGPVGFSALVYMTSGQYAEIFFRGDTSIQLAVGLYGVCTLSICRVK